MSAASGAGGYDPLMFLASSIFAIALCMLALRLFPLVLRLLAAAAARLPQAWSYLAVQEITRRPRDHASAMLLIMISLSFAIFSASMAKTLDRWLHDSQYYLAGADLVVREYEMPRSGNAGDGAPPVQQNTPNLSQAVESMVSLERHLQLPAIQSATYAGKWNGRFTYGAQLEECNVMGIDRLSFPQTAFYRRDFADQSLGALMNALANQPMGVLLPEKLANDIGLRPGDRLHVETTIGVGEVFSADMTVAGLYRYFPTVYPSEKPTLIANLDTLFGSPEAVRREVRERIDVMARGGRYVLSSMHYLMDDVPIDNILAMYAEARDYRPPWS